MRTETVLLTLSAEGIDSELFAGRRADLVHAVADAMGFVDLKKERSGRRGIMFKLSAGWNTEKNEVYPV